MNANRTPNSQSPLYRGQISELLCDQGIPSQNWQTIWMGSNQPGVEELRDAAPRAGQIETYGRMTIDVTSKVRVQRRRELLGRFAAGWKTLAEIDLSR